MTMRSATLKNLTVLQALLCDLRAMSAEPARQAAALTPASDVRHQPRAPAADGAARGQVIPLKAMAARTAAPDKRRGSSRDSLRDLLEPNWELMAPIIAGAGVLNALITLSLPQTTTVLMLLPAICCAGLSRFAARFERERVDDAGRRNLLLLVMVGLPMLLFGLAMARWTELQHTRWDDSMGLLVIAGALAAIILHRRVASIIVANVALWSGVAVVAKAEGTYFALLIGVGLGIFTSLRQAKSDEQAAHADRERQHAQLRAEEILRDFEQTGQGWFWETDRRGQLLYVSPPIGEALGRPSKQLLGKPLSELFVADPQGQESERTLAFHLNARSAFSELARQTPSARG